MEFSESGFIYNPKTDEAEERQNKQTNKQNRKKPCTGE